MCALPNIMMINVQIQPGFFWLTTTFKQLLKLRSSIAEMQCTLMFAPTLINGKAQRHVVYFGPFAVLKR